VNHHNGGATGLRREATRSWLWFKHAQCWLARRDRHCRKYHWLEGDAWRGIFAASGVPRDIVETLTARLNAILHQARCGAFVSCRNDLA